MDNSTRNAYSLLDRVGDTLPATVGIVRARGLAGMLALVPPLRALREALPDSQITLISSGWGRDFSQRFSYYVDDYMELPGFPGFSHGPVAIDRIPFFLQSAQARRFDLVLQLQGCNTSPNLLASLLGARAVAGHYLPGQFCPDHRRFLLYPVGEPEVKRMLDLLTWLGVPSQGESLEFPIYAADWTAFKRVLGAQTLETFSYACLQAPTAETADLIPLDRWVGLARGLTARGMRLVLIGNQRNAESIQAAVGADCLSLAGGLGVGGLAALLSGCRIFISQQGGTSALAEALRIPRLILHLEDKIDLTGDDSAGYCHDLRWATISPTEEILRTADELLSSLPFPAVRAGVK